ncbi:MAG TPA: polyprenyl synthetase family protein, partial [Planctomycetota bacterium]|nr:polyprenyl synthetase family protein [Planctomycetota bacterium]
CAYQALQEDPHGEPPEALRKAAVAVECFHKASLIHDDIEDGDRERYGERTLHEEHGVPVALNVGDWLIGEGYRLLAECEASAERKVAMLACAARGHRTLCLGQGRELWWARHPEPLASVDVLRIFREKTAPAFQVALELGAIYAGADEAVLEVLARYSEALGIAYQIRDDIHDLTDAEAPSDLRALRPTLPLALGFERAKKDSREKEILGALWKRTPLADGEEIDPEALRAMLEELGVGRRAHELLAAYKEEAVRSLWDVAQPNLKGLLRRVIGKIFNDTEIKGWCREFEARNAAGGEVGASPAA